MASPAAASMPRLLSQRLLTSNALLRVPIRRARPTTTTTPATPALRRPASTKAKDASRQQQPIVLEKPDKFRPPSHPARLPRKTPRYQYGPQLTDAQRMAQRTKKYPHMMPPEGTFMHWFLTNRMLHAYISLVSPAQSSPAQSTLSSHRHDAASKTALELLLLLLLSLPFTNTPPRQFVLLSLAFSTFALNFVHTTPYAALLPARADFLSHPFRALRQALDVYKMHAEHVSAETAERRKRKVDDIDKRNEFKRAHGIDVEEGGKGLLGGLLGDGKNEDGKAAEGVVGAVDASPVAPVEEPLEAEKPAYTDFEGRKRPLKKWLGIG